MIIFNHDILHKYRRLYKILVRYRWLATLIPSAKTFYGVQLKVIYLIFSLAHFPYIFVSYLITSKIHMINYSWINILWLNSTFFLVDLFWNYFRMFYGHSGYLWSPISCPDSDSSDIQLCEYRIQIVTGSWCWGVHIGHNL